LARSRLLWLAGIGLLPDLDLLIGRHSMESHSVGAAMLAGALAAWLRCPVARSRSRIFLAVCLAWVSHPLLDALGADSSPPYGVMLLWPFSSEHVMAGPVFDAISRRWWLPGFVSGNLAAMTKEVLILGPLALAYWAWNSRQLSAAQRPGVTSDGGQPR
jgi:membrane-bound metal-dependent hydrolase YbcI (DUF457 family)